MHNLSAFVQYHARRRPDALAVVYEDQRVTYAALETRALAAAGWLRERGIGEGDVVALVMKNSAAFLELAIGASHIGAVLLPINFRLAGDEIAYIRDDAGARLVIADDEFADTVAGLPQVTLLDDAMRRDIRVLAGDGVEPPAMARRTGGDLFRLMYTSGTTDRPKGVMHSYDNFYWKCIDHVMALQLSARDRLLVVGPMYHVGAFDLPGVAVLWMGGTLVILREFAPEAVLETIARERVTGMWLAPVMLNAILNEPDRGRHDVTSLRWCIGGGERTPESRIRQFTELFAEGRYIDAYGLTESCSGDTLMEPGREIEKIGSTGRALAHVELEIRDEAGRTLGPAEEGEICLRGPKITRGYWNDPDKTAAAFHADGWFRTGDVGYLDAEGFLYLTDRKKDMIISGGENIASSEVERVIYRLPEVSEAAVVGRPDPRWGERVVAVVVPKPGATLDLAGLEAHCRRHLAGFKVPKELHIVDALPRNPSGKVLKRVLRETLARQG